MTEVFKPLVANLVPRYVEVKQSECLLLQKLRQTFTHFIVQFSPRHINLLQTLVALQGQPESLITLCAYPVVRQVQYF